MESITARSPLRRANQMDFQLFTAVLLLCLFGLVMLFSASYYYATYEKGDGLKYLKSQGLYFIGGVVLMLVLSRLDYHKWEKIRGIALGATVLMMLLVFVPAISGNLNGATRWIKIEVGGREFSFQPSELAKFVLVLYMASFLSRKQHLMGNFIKGVVPMLLIMGLFSGILLLQKNMSMMVILLLTGAIMLYLGGVKMKFLLMMGAAALVLMVVAVLLERYRMTRLTIFLDPWSDPQYTGYQLCQSLIGIGSGGIFGKGLNFSRQKLLFLPYGESDFIFSIIAEELGLVGCIALMLVYVFIVYRGIRIAIRCKDRFGSLLAGGITSVIGTQAAINIGVATSSIPTTGQTLPFVSSGGTSLIIFMCAVGILLNISRNIEDA